MNYSQFSTFKTTCELWDSISSEYAFKKKNVRVYQLLSCSPYAGSKAKKEVVSKGICHIVIKILPKQIVV